MFSQIALASVRLPDLLYFSESFTTHLPLCSDVFLPKELALSVPEELMHQVPISAEREHDSCDIVTTYHNKGFMIFM